MLAPATVPAELCILVVKASTVGRLAHAETARASTPTLNKALLEALVPCLLAFIALEVNKSAALAY